MEPLTFISVVCVLYGCWHFYMMTRHPDTYLKLRAQERQRQMDIINTVGKFAAPPAIKLLTKFLKW